MCDTVGMANARVGETVHRDQGPGVTARAYALLGEALSRPSRAMDPGIVGKLSPRLSRDLSHVRIHDDDKAAESARALGADAYTFGHRIVFGRGKFDPGSVRGTRLIMHELSHASPVAHAVMPAASGIADFASAHEVHARAVAAGQASLNVPAAPVPVPGVIYRQSGGAAEDVRSFTAKAESVTVDITGARIRISGTLAAYGDEASAANAKQAEDTIRKYWNAVFPDGVTVSCDVSVIYVPKGSSLPSGINSIEMVKRSSPSAANSLTGNITLNMKEGDALTWAVAHEFGHVVGLKDRYSEGIVSSLRGFVGLTRSATPADPGYEHSLMAEVGGSTTERTARNVTLENEPSFLQTDDQIRLWVARHDAGGIRALSLATKTQMINTLLDYWVSSEDVTAIESICSAITDKAESTTVKGILENRVTSITGSGLRARLRLAVAKMP